MRRQAGDCKCSHHRQQQQIRLFLLLIKADFVCYVGLSGVRESRRAVA